MEAIEQSNLPPKAKQEKLERLRPSLDHHWAEAYRLTKSNFELQDAILRPAWDALQKAKGELEQARKGNDQQAIRAAAHNYTNVNETYVNAQLRHTEAFNLTRSKYW